MAIHSVPLGDGPSSFRKDAISRSAGAQVRGRQRGTIVVFTKKLTVGDEEEERPVSMLRTYTVFNVAQTSLSGSTPLSISRLTM